MASAVARDGAFNNESNSLNPRISFQNISRENVEECQLSNQINARSSSEYTLTSGRSQFSYAMDTWMAGTPTESTDVQRSRVAAVQRSTMVTPSSIGSTDMWYILAMVLPLFSFNNVNFGWRCTPSTLLNTAELFFTQIATVCDRVKDRIRRLAEDHLARDIFATAMDIVLVIYAMGFLIISMYQASVIG
ncbi:uncharacterized protein LOC131848714 [Achroia grisella]|uniref:uncharacterized protein LOC131848714 n=1 Tax=Achroia grisella TaxID=688607 RepID=UPI0027D2376B|nr:uncharacterized protein LOC131848714 [Achroia grisella]